MILPPTVKMVCAMFAVTMLISACAPSDIRAPMTPEEEKLKQAMQARILDVLANTQLPQSASQQKQDLVQSKGTEPKLTEEQLAVQVAAFPRIATGVQFTKFRDGFSINNGERYIDPEGEITNYGYNWKNGDVTYLIKTGENQYKIKYVRVLTSKAPITIAEAHSDGAHTTVTTVTGSEFGGDGLILTSKGFIVVRNDSAFVYEIGKPSTSYTPPAGWHIAMYQNGDVASTKFMLLEKDSLEEKGQSNPLTELIESGKALADTFGLTRKPDYMLVNITNQSQQHLFNISLEGKNVHEFSDCRQTSKYIATCNNMETSHALYDNNGMPNTAHYYWRVLWLSTQNGAIAVTRENTQTTVMLTDLYTGKRAKAAYRTTGFPGISATQNNKGVIRVAVSGGLLPGEVIEDAEAFLATAKAEDSLEKQK